MSRLTGKTVDFNFQAMWPEGLVIVFTPSGNATTTDGNFLATRPIRVTPDTDGNWWVDLVDIDHMHQNVWYTVTLEWLNPDAGYTDKDFPQWRIYVPDGDQNFTDLVTATASNPLMVFWQPTAPDPWPLQMVWVNTITGDVNRKVA